MEHPRIETHAFETEAAQLLDLMIHSVYSHKEIFLRELISNASDALDKLCFEALTNPDLRKYTSDPHIRIEVDPKARTLSVSDNGIGMTHDEIVRNIGTIAHSGTQEFLRALKEAKSKETRPELIGQFGVGFYSSFMVAEKVTMISRAATEERAWRWESAGGAGSYTLEPAERAEPGVTVTLHLRKEDAEDGLDDYTSPWKIKEIVRRYSDFVAYPIKMETQRTETPRDEEGKPIEGTEPKTIVEDETLNSMKAIWTRPEKEVEESDYLEFYKHISHDWHEPLERIAYKAEGTSEFRALLFVPSHAPFDMFMPESEYGILLYVKRVFIMHDCKDLIPEYLRFVRGVVDSEDLSLNISREILQKNRHIQLIRKSVTNKVLDTLKQLRTEKPEKFETFWREFGKVVKEGLFRDPANREKLLDVCTFASTFDPQKETTLANYVARMKEGQEHIYYLTGKSREAVEHSPHLEAFREKGYEVLLLTDPVDEVWAPSLYDGFQEKQLQSAAKGAATLGSEEERKATEQALEEKAKSCTALFETLQKILDEHVKEVRLSARLTTSPVCLVGNENDLTPQMEQLLRATGQEVPRVKRVLEINPNHPILEKLQTHHAANADDPRLADLVALLHGQALLAEGLQPPDPSAFSQKLAELMIRAM